MRLIEGAGGRAAGTNRGAAFLHEQVGRPLDVRPEPRVAGGGAGFDGPADRRFQRIEALQQDGAIGVLAGCKRVEDAAEVAFLALHFVDQARSRLLFADEAGGVGFDETHRIDGDPARRQQDQDQECEAGRQDRQEYRPTPFHGPYLEFGTWGLR